MSSNSEFDFIHKLANTSQFIHPLVKQGIGDDAAVLGGIDHNEELIITTDALMEGVDFLTAECGYYLAGRKSLAVNLSDLAAMAALPVAAFVNLVLPKNISPHDLAELMRGIMELAQEFQLTIAGGDTNSWGGKLVISITAIGRCPKDKAIKRCGAKPGDLIIVSGALGGSIMGHHLTFTPRIQLAQQLTQHLNITSMLDLSDGLSGDLAHLLRASKVGAILYLEKIPLTNAAKNMHDQRSPLEHALHDGEDFELLCTIPQIQIDLLSKLTSAVPLTIIGEITKDLQYFVRDADQQLHPMQIHSWSHPLGT
jgi:thiamine-monophosphate kinase